MKGIWSETLDLELSQVDGYPCLRLAGEGEGQGARLLEARLTELIRRGRKRLVLDTRRLRFLDPRCCAVLEAVARRLAAEGGLMVAVDRSLPLERTLKLPGIEGLMPVVPTLRQATTYLSSYE